MVTVGVLVLVRPAAREKDDNGVASLRKTTDVIPQVVARTILLRLPPVVAEGTMADASSLLPPRKDMSAISASDSSCYRS